MLKLEHIVKDYDTGDIHVRALGGIDLEVSRGDYVAIMGPSGSGKSTLMHIIGCLDRPTAGSYLLNGRDVAEMNDADLARTRNKEIGFVFQQFNLLARETLLANVEVPLMYAGVGARQRHKLAADALNRMGILDRALHRPSEVSGGQKQRAAIARALVNSPSLILADEPTGNLDSKTGCEILDIIDSLNREGATVIVVTHDREVGRRARCVVNLRDGLIDSVEATAHDHH